MPLNLAKSALERRGRVRSMMRPSAAAITLVTGIACASNPPQVSGSNAARPNLVVLVVVDQLRADLLDRYADLFTGGFKRLADNGHNYINAAHDHSGTETAVGHATLATGVYP